MKIFVTGATGSLGIPLCLELKKSGHEVIGLGRHPRRLEFLKSHDIKVHRGDLLTEDLSALLQDSEAIVHSAALTSPWGKREDFVKANITASERLFEAALKKDLKRFVHISTPSIYYDGTSKLHLTEKSPLPSRQQTFYSETKLECEILAKSFFAKGLPLITLRPRAILSVYDQTLIPRLLRLMKKGFLPMIDGGHGLIDVTPAESVALAVQKSLEASDEYLGENYNITNDEPVPVRILLSEMSRIFDLPVKWIRVSSATAARVAFLLEKTWPIFTEDAPPLTRYSVDLISKSQTFDISKAKSELGYRPAISNQEAFDGLKSWRSFE